MCRIYERNQFEAIYAYFLFCSFWIYLSSRCLWSERWSLMLLCLRMLWLHFRCLLYSVVLFCLFDVFQWCSSSFRFFSLSNATNFSLDVRLFTRSFFICIRYRCNVIHVIAVIHTTSLSCWQFLVPFIFTAWILDWIGLDSMRWFSVMYFLNAFMRSLLLRFQFLLHSTYNSLWNCHLKI